MLKSFQPINYDKYKSLHGVEIESCTICMECLNEDSKVIGLKCNERHCFHEECLKKWTSIKLTCPFCRIDMTPEHLKDNESRYSDISI